MFTPNLHKAIIDPHQMVYNEPRKKSDRQRDARHGYDVTVERHSFCHRTTAFLRAFNHLCHNSLVTNVVTDRKR